MEANRFARWARTCGLCGLVPFALVFGLIGLYQVRRSGQRGRGMAITGLVAALVWSLLLFNLVDALSPQVHRSPGGGVEQAQADTVLDLQPGDCFQVRSRTPDGGIQWVLFVPCTQTHDGRVYATPALHYVADQTVDLVAKAACTKALPSSAPSSASFGFVYPQPAEYETGNSHASCFTQP